MEAASTVIIVKENKKPDNILKDYQALFRPFTIVQDVFMLSKYKLKNNIVLPNSTFYNVLSVVYSLALLICHHFSTFRPFYANKCKGSLLERYVCVMQESPVLWLGIFINVCTNIVQRQNNVLFALKIQNVCTFLRNSGSNIDRFTIFNWCNVIFDIGFQISWILIFNYAFTSTMHTYELLGNVIYVIFDTNIIYTITLMRFLLMAFRSWIDESKKWHLETNFNNRVYWNKMFGDYVDIYEAYEIVAKVFNPLILFCYIKTYIHTLFGILFRIQAGKVYNEGILKYLLTSFVSLIWLFKDVTLFILLSVECEKLYSMMKEVQNICIQLAEIRPCSDIQQNTCKNIVRHQIVSFKKMELCGLFAVDAALMLNFASIITSNIIVAFQFEFL